MAAAVIAAGTVAERTTREVLGRELERRVVLESRNLAMTSSRALLSEFPELMLTPILNEMDAGRDELAFAVVTDLEDTIRGHADARLIGEPFDEPADALPRASNDLALVRGEMLLENTSLLLASAPVHHPNGSTIGRAWVAVDRGHVASVVAETRRRQALVVLAVLVVGVLVVMGSMGVMLRPIGALRAGLERIGRGDLESPVRLRDRTEFGLLADTMNEMATAIREAQEQQVEQERLTREVELAREIQSSLLPQGDTHTGDMVLDGSHRAAAEVGGDLWDVFPLEGDRIGITIADVSGKGLGGCLVTSMLSAVLRAFRNEEQSPSRLLTRLEESLPIRPGTFVTMFYGILDPASGSLVFASAGHSPLLVHRASSGKSEWYRTKGIPIGAVRGGALGRTLQDERIVLEEGDVLVQYTDGINEAFGRDGEEQFGFERLRTAVAESAPRGARAVIKRVRDDVEAWVGDQPPHDDETLVVIARQSQEAQRATNGTAAPGASFGGADSPSPKFDPVRLVASARAKGHGISFSASLDELHRLTDWVRTCPELKLQPREYHVLETALYESCANVAEHGYGGDRASSFELWWLPCEEATQAVGGDVSCGTAGVFILIDDGTSFDPNTTPADFRSPRVRRRGRGIGLTIVQSAMARISYHPKTQEGNVTVLLFDPDQVREEEAFHG
jgi:serine phosphatase RsbU (regulator of sigma subunit)/anti-sigma regulatory factor (Ser/Thr protein kinase)